MQFQSFNGILRIINIFFAAFFWYSFAMTKKLFFTLLALMFFAPVSANADTADLDRQLRDHTFVYIDKKTGLEHTIYFGRFGKVYDEYFPCKFVDGTWRINDAGTLCLEDTADKSRRDGKTCLKPKINGTKISFFDSAGNLAYQSKLTKGNGMPLG